MMKINTRLTSDMNKKLEQYAQDRGITTYEATRDLIIYALEEKEKRDQILSEIESLKSFLITNLYPIRRNCFRVLAGIMYQLKKTVGLDEARKVELKIEKSLAELEEELNQKKG